MRIGIDARMLGSHTGGLGRYAEQLVRQLKEVYKDHTFVLFLNDDNWDLVEEAPHIKKVLVDLPWYGWKEQILFPRIIARQHLDLMHFPHWNVPLLYRGRFVVTIHDLIMFHYPRPDATTHGPLVYAVKDTIHRMVLRQAAKRAVHLLVPTQWVASDVSSTLHVSQEKITVTYEAPFEKVKGENSMGDIESKHGIRPPYCLYVGSGYPHENLERLIDIWADVQDEIETAYQLVLVGSKNRFYDRLADRVEGRDDIRFTGYVTDEALAALYQHAELFIFPSFSEGFGLPPLEAMMYGTPVVSSNASCMPEVLGEAALYFDPHDDMNMRDTIVRALGDEEIRFYLRAQAKEELSRYSWGRLTRETMHVYESAIKG